MIIKQLHTFKAIAITFWIGGMWTAGYVVTPIIFSTLTDRTLAGDLAGKIFSGTAWVGIVCAIYLLLLQLQQVGKKAFSQRYFRMIVFMLILILAGHFAIQPILANLKAQALPLEVMKSTFSEQFSMWHRISSVLFLIQSLLGVALVASHDKNL
ncbi:MAG: DUF4149 domain-containing protein [Bdellovibrionales bacterium]